MKNVLAIFFFYVLITLCILAFLSVQAIGPSADKPGQVQKANITFKIIDTENTFSYVIFLNDQELVGKSSNRSADNTGFKSREEAERIALSVIDRLKKGEMLSRNSKGSADDKRLP